MKWFKKHKKEEKKKTGRDELDSLFLSLSNEDLVDWLIHNDFVNMIVTDQTIQGKTNEEKMLNFLSSPYELVDKE